MNRILYWLAALLAAAAPVTSIAQEGPPREPDAIPLYGEATPGTAGTEIWTTIAGGRALMVRNVTRPTLTPVLPAPGKATGAAVIVAPGGAFVGLAMKHEGWDVARRLAERGIAAFVLKYRLIPTVADEAQSTAFTAQLIREALEGDPHTARMMRLTVAPLDALAALAMVRDRAGEWRVDPKRVGMIGFSAGAMTSLHTALRAEPGTGPDFFGYIYGPMNSVEVPADAPPMFAAIAMDDLIFPTMGFPIVEAWRKARRPVELHAYQKGSHGFGLGSPGTTNSLLMDQFVAWLDMQGLLGAGEGK